MKKSSYLLLVLLVAFMLSIQGNVVAQTQYKWVMQISTPAGSGNMVCALELAEKIYQASGGRLQIDVKPGGAVVPMHDVMEAVKHGVLDCAAPNPTMDLGRLGNKALLLGSSGFPAGPTAIEFLAWAYKGDGLKYLKQVYEPFGVQAIGWVATSPPELFCHSNRILDDLEAFRGIKFRTMGAWSEILADIGASVVTVDGGEVYQAMDRGIIDAFEYCGPAIDWDSGFQEIGKYIGVPGIHSPSTVTVFMVNPRKWNQLPDDLKRIVEDQVLFAGLNDYFTFAWEDAQAFEKFVEYGTEVFEVKESAQEEIAVRSYELCMKWAKQDKLFREIFENQAAFFKTWRNLDKKQYISHSVYDLYQAGQQ